MKIPMLFRSARTAQWSVAREGFQIALAIGLASPIVWNRLNRCIITAYEPDPAEWEHDWRTRKVME